LAGHGTGLLFRRQAVAFVAEHFSGHIAVFRRFCVIRLTVLYGHPADPIEFDRYYHETHIPLAQKMEGLRGWTIGKCQSASPDEPPEYYMIVGLYADSRAAMEAILATPQGQETVADVANFATGGATFLYSEDEVLIPYEVK
jgi:uncharacterized protein (TIGR02118 family)